MAPRKKKESPLVSKEAWHVFAGLAFLVVVFLVLTSLFSKVGTFEYDGLTFVQEKFGDLDVFRYTYHYQNLKGGVNTYNLYLRVDPRLNDVPLEGMIELPPKSREIYVSVDTSEMTQCPLSGVGISSLSAFLVNNEFKVKGATPYLAEAELRNLTFADCESHPNHAVIILQMGNETKITREQGRCWVIQAADCQLVDAVEKFEIETILQAKARES